MLPLALANLGSRTFVRDAELQNRRPFSPSPDRVSQAQGAVRVDLDYTEAVFLRVSFRESSADGGESVPLELLVDRLELGEEVATDFVEELPGEGSDEASVTF